MSSEGLAWDSAKVLCSFVHNLDDDDDHDDDSEGSDDDDPRGATPRGAKESDGVLDPWFEGVAKEERIMSPLHFWLIEKHMSWKCGQAFNVGLCIVEAVCFVMPRWFYPKTDGMLPMFIPLLAVYAFFLSVSAIVMFYCVQKFMNSSEAFKSFLMYSLDEVKADSALQSSLQPTPGRVIRSFMVHSCLMSVVALDFKSLPGVCLLFCIIIQASSVEQVATVIRLALFVGRVPAHDFLKVIQSEKRRMDRRGRANDQTNASTFWPAALRSYKVLEIAMASYYHDISTAIVANLAQYIFIATLFMAFVQAGCHRVAPNTWLNLCAVAVGLFLGIHMSATGFYRRLTVMTSTTELCSGKETYARTPTILSTAYGFTGSDDLTHIEQRDLDRFIGYVKESNAGAHLFASSINTAAIAKLTAGAAVFQWVVSSLVEVVRERGSGT